MSDDSAPVKRGRKANAEKVEKEVKADKTDKADLKKRARKVSSRNPSTTAFNSSIVLGNKTC